MLNSTKKKNYDLRFQSSVISHITIISCTGTRCLAMISHLSIFSIKLNFSICFFFALTKDRISGSRCESNAHKLLRAKCICKQKQRRVRTEKKCILKIPLSEFIEIHFSKMPASSHTLCDNKKNRLCQMVYIYRERAGGRKANKSYIFIKLKYSSI